MSYTPNPYANATVVDKWTMRRYKQIDVSLELPDPIDEDAEYIEHDLAMFYTVAPAEPDVGIFEAFVGEFFYCLPDGGIPPEDVWYAIDTIDARRDGHASPYVNRTVQIWHERNMQDAIEAASQPDYED